MPSKKGATPEKAHILKRILNPAITWVGKWWPLLFLLLALVVMTRAG